MVLITTFHIIALDWLFIGSNRRKLSVFLFNLSLISSIKAAVSIVSASSSNIDNSSKYNTHNEEINYSLGNSKNLAIADETDDSNRKTFSKRKITSMQFHNFSSLDTGPENKSIKMNDMTKYSFITKQI